MMTERILSPREVLLARVLGASERLMRVFLDGRDDEVLRELPAKTATATIHHNVVELSALYDAVKAELTRQYQLELSPQGECLRPAPSSSSGSLDAYDSLFRYKKRIDALTDRLALCERLWGRTASAETTPQRTEASTGARRGIAGSFRHADEGVRVGLLHRPSEQRSSDSSRSREHDGILEAMDTLAATLQERSIHIGERLRSERQVLVDASTAVEGNLSTASRETGRLGKHGQSACATFCHAMGWMLSAALLFVATYLIIRTIPKNPNWF